MAGDLEGIRKDITLRWENVEDLPVLMANQFFVQADIVGESADLFILAVGQATPPAILGSEDERRAAVEAITEVRVTPLARFSLTATRIHELAGLLAQVAAVLQQGDSGSSVSPDRAAQA